MRLLVWLLRALVFFALFAFALNNQHDAQVHWFFGRTSSAPMVFIVLGAFALGCAFGVFAMVPSWWRQQRAAAQRRRAETPSIESMQMPPAPGETPLEHPPRDGL
jgi:uncharacterized integral membrane protein